MVVRQIKISGWRAASAGKAATPRIGLQRLERLAGILEKAHTRYKKIGAIFKDAYEEWDEEFDNPLPVQGYDQTTVGHACGTPACALGHYAFNTKQRFGWTDRGDVLSAEGYLGGALDQAKHEFAINEHEVNELFGGLGCGQTGNEDGVDYDNLITAKDAAKYIRRFVAKKRKALGLKKPVKAKIEPARVAIP